MTSPGVNGCWCGCDKPLRDSEFWAGEACAQAWMRRINQLPPLPPEKLGSFPLAAAAFATAYMRAVETPPVEPTGSVAAESTPAGPSLRHFEAAVDDVTAHVNAVLNDLGPPTADFEILWMPPAETPHPGRGRSVVAMAGGGRTIPAVLVLSAVVAVSGALAAGSWNHRRAKQRWRQP